MTPDEIAEFLGGVPARLAVLSTHRSDGRPHAAPVWYVPDNDGALVFTTGAHSVKGRNLRRSRRAALCVHDEVPPYRFVLTEGPIDISEQPLALRHWAGVIGGRYMGADRAEEFGARNGVAGELLVRVSPEKVTAFRNLAD